MAKSVVENRHFFQCSLDHCPKNGSLRVQLETPRLIIRSFRDEDFSSSTALYGDVDLSLFFDFGKPKSNEEVHQLMSQKGVKYFLSGEPWGIYSIFCKSTYEFIGHIDILPYNDDQRYLEIGYIIRKEFQGKGLATEAAQYFKSDYVPLMIQKGYLSNGNSIQGIVATVHPENIASQKILEKLGMKYLKTLFRFEQPRHLYSIDLCFIDAHLQNDRCTNVEKYVQFGLQGTSWLGFRDLPEIFKTYVLGRSGVDFGCGAGRSTRFLKSLNLDVVGVDISEKMIAAAKNMDPECKFDKIENGRIPLADKTCDFVFSSYVFLVIPSKYDLEKILCEMRRVMKDDGTLVILTGSDVLHSKEMNWLTYDVNFPENDHLSSGSLVKIRNKDVGAEFIDYNWLTQDYREVFQKTGFKILKEHFPLGKKEDPFLWRSELCHSPCSIYVLKKQLST